MSAAHNLATLRDSIERLETHGAAYGSRKVPLGHSEADASLQGGLALGAVHEVFAEAGRQSAVATGFVAGISGRVAARRPVVWIRQDFTEVEAGTVSMSGFSELGLDPRLLSMPPTSTMPCERPRTHSPAMRWAPLCWRSGARRDNSILSPAAS
jgi:protein ImuA